MGGSPSSCCVADSPDRIETAEPGCSTGKVDFVVTLNLKEERVYGGHSTFEEAPEEAAKEKPLDEPEDVVRLGVLSKANFLALLHYEPHHVSRFYKELQEGKILNVFWPHMKSWFSCLGQLCKRLERLQLKRDRRMGAKGNVEDRKFSANLGSFVYVDLFERKFDSYSLEYVAQLTHYNGDTVSLRFTNKPDRDIFAFAIAQLVTVLHVEQNAGIHGFSHRLHRDDDGFEVDQGEATYLPVFSRLSQPPRSTTSMLVDDTDLMEPVR